MICESTLAAGPGFSSTVAGSWLLAFDRALMFGLPLVDPVRPVRTFRLTLAERTEAGRACPIVIAVTVCEVGNKLLRSGANHFHGSIDRRGRDQPRFSLFAQAAHRRILDPGRGVDGAEPRPHDRCPRRPGRTGPADDRHVSACAAQDRR